MSFGHLIENIDIGGPSMVRSAAKNFEDVAIVTNVVDYPDLIAELKNPDIRRRIRAAGFFLRHTEAGRLRGSLSQ